MSCEVMLGLPARRFSDRRKKFVYWSCRLEQAPIFPPSCSNSVGFQISAKIPRLLCLFTNAVGPAASRSQSISICACVRACVRVCVCAMFVIGM